MSKVSVNLTLVRVVEGFTARPGDRLMITPSGHCLGVYTGAAAPLEAKAPKPVAKPKPAAKTRGVPSHRTEAARAAIDASVLELVRANPGIPSPEVANLLGLTGVDRKNLRANLKRLKARGALSMERVSSNSKSGYRLTAK